MGANGKEDFAGVKDLVRDDHIPIASVRVVQMIGPEGQQCYVTTYEGEATLSTFLGLVEMAKFDIITRFADSEETDDDEGDDGDEN